MSTSRFVAAFAALSALGASAAAQTVITGNVSDGAGGPLLSGVVYHVVGGITVPAATTLTVQPGAIVKFGVGTTASVLGTLLAGAPAGQPVIVTSIKDDSAGGDTNGDGPSSGTPGDWVHMRFFSSASASVVENVTVRFSGSGGWNPVRLDNCAATFRDCTIEDNLGAGFNLTNAMAQPTIADCTIRNNSGWAIEGARFESVLNFSNNSATGNGANSVLLSVSALATDAVVHARCGINGVLTMQSGVVVPAGNTLTLKRGVILKFLTSATCDVSGTLLCEGTAGQRVVFTSFSDDASGGDSNSNGPSSGTPGQWSVARFHSSSGASSLDNTSFRFGGGGGWTPLRIENAAPSFTNCIVEHAPGTGVLLASSAGAPTLSGCTVRNNGSWAIQAQGLESIVNLSGNSATGNGFNALQVLGAAPTIDVSVGPQMGISNTVCLQFGLALAAGRTLTLQAGTILKPTQNVAYSISGALIANGTSAQPVVFTSFADDAYGGDTNNDGVSSGSPGQWSVMRLFATSSASRLTNTVFRHGGAGGWNSIYIEGSNSTLERCIIERGANAGINLVNQATQARIDDCTVRDCSGSAITGIPINSLPFITRLKASGNSANRVDVTTATLASDLYLDGNMGLNGVACVFTPLHVPAGRKLTLGPGAIFKLSAGQTVNVFGALDVVATREKPAVFTALSDDALGGDSDGSPAPPAPGQWTFVVIDATAAASRIENLLVRYGGAGGWSALRANSPLAEYRHVRVDRAGSAGFEVGNAARADFLTAWSCGTTGIALTGGAFSLDHATANGCATGVSRTAGWTGAVRNTVSFGNTTNFTGLVAASVSYSNAFVGGVGNLNSNPLFVNAALGDLNLQPGSGCIDAGDPSSPVDADCTRTDMGAYPSGAAPTLYCTGKTNSFGCTPYLGYSGFARATLSDPLVVRSFDVLNDKFGLFFYGYAGRTSVPFQGGLKCVSDPVVRTPTQSSGGLVGFANCSGVFTLDLTARINSGVDPLLVPGATLAIQCWYRDPAAAFGTGLSNALDLSICN